MFGSFDIDATVPELKSLKELKIDLSVSRLWAYFELNSYACIMRFAFLPTEVGDTCTFTSRGEVPPTWWNTHVVSVKGTLTFLGDGKIKGVIEGGLVERLTFNGMRKDEVAAWKKRYESIQASATAIIEGEP